MLILKFIREKIINLLLWLIFISILLLIVYLLFYFLSSEGQNLNIGSNYDYLRNSVQKIENSEDDLSEVVYYENYEMTLIIDEIGLYNYIYSFGSINNNVDINLEHIKGSAFPDSKYGVVILAGHSGTSDFAYFNDLNKLSLGNTAEIKYKSISYAYILYSSYDIEKTGNFEIPENIIPGSLVLITCKVNTNFQTVYIFEKI